MLIFMFIFIFLKKAKKVCKLRTQKTWIYPRQYNLLNTAHPENVISPLMGSSWIHMDQKKSFNDNF